MVFSLSHITFDKLAWEAFNLLDNGQRNITEDLIRRLSKFDQSLLKTSTLILNGSTSYLLQVNEDIHLVYSFDEEQKLRVEDIYNAHAFRNYFGKQH